MTTKNLRKYVYQPETFNRYRQERDYFNFLSGILATMPDSMIQLSKEITDITVERYDTIMKCAEEGKPFVAGYFCAALEIYEAMGLPWYMIMATPFLAASAPYGASLMGGFGGEAKQAAENLLRSNLVHFIATDAHSANGRPPVLSEAVRAAAKIVGKEQAWKMVTEYPQAILEGRRPSLPEPSSL